jgi:hypothetical protein
VSFKLNPESPGWQRRRGARASKPERPPPVQTAMIASSLTAVRLYSQEESRTGRRRNLGTFKMREAPKKHERAVHYFKRQ